MGSFFYKVRPNSSLLLKRLEASYMAGLRSTKGKSTMTDS